MFKRNIPRDKMLVKSPNQTTKRQVSYDSVSSAKVQLTRCPTFVDGPQRRMKRCGFADYDNISQVISEPRSSLEPLVFLSLRELNVHSFDFGF